MRPLHHRLTLGIVSALGVLLAVVGVLVYPAITTFLRSEFDNALLLRARQLTGQDATGSPSLDWGFTNNMAREFQSGPDAEYLQVQQADGTLVARSPSLGDFRLTLRKTNEPSPAFFNVKLPDGRRGRAVSLRLSVQAEHNASTDGSEVFAVFARDTEHLRHVLAVAHGTLVGVGVVTLGLAGWFVLVLTRKGLRPYAALAAQVQRIQPNSLDLRLDPRGLPGEMIPMVEQLNHLMERLESAFARERRFSANAAHELLTPVTELRAAAENAIRWSDDPEATAGLARATYESAGHMERLVQTLLELAKPEPDGSPAIREQFDLVALVRNCAKPHHERFAAKSLTVEYFVPESAGVSGSQAAGLSIVQNLLTNAVNYTPPGGRIRCQIDRVTTKVRLTLANTNPGLEATDLPKLWEPFWRRDTARTDRTHSGLGLVLVHELARAHGWDVTASLPTAAWFQVELLMPAANMVNQTGGYLDKAHTRAETS